MTVAFYYMVLVGHAIILFIILSCLWTVFKRIWQGILTRNYGQIKVNALLLAIMLIVLISCTWLSNPIEGISHLLEKVSNM